VVTVENLKRKILENEIVYIERQQSKCIIFTKQKEYKVYETVTSLIERLSDDFLRVNQSFIVNINEINYIKKNSIILKNNIDIPIGRTYKKHVLNIYYNK
jgi:DNA-binding LytR/AlgR family response regulator